MRQTPWPIGLHSLKEQRRKEEREREQKTRHQPQEEQQLLLMGGEVGQSSAGPQLEELLEQDRRQEPQEPQGQQQQRGQQSEGPLEPPPHSPPQSVLPAPQEPGNQEEGLPVFGPPTLAWLGLGAPAAIPAESGRADGMVALACTMRTPVDPESEIRRTIYGMDGLPRDSSGSVGPGRNVFPPRRTRLERWAVVEAVKPGPGRRWTTMGSSLPSSTCSCATGGHSRLSRSSSAASRRGLTRIWRIGAPTGSVSGLHRSV